MDFQFRQNRIFCLETAGDRCPTQILSLPDETLPASEKHAVNARWSPRGLERNRIARRRFARRWIGVSRPSSVYRLFVASRFGQEQNALDALTCTAMRTFGHFNLRLAQAHMHFDKSIA